MKLLLDQNLSWKLVKRMEDLFPDCSHVRLLGIEKEDDPMIWEYAKHHGYIIVTQDIDFFEISILRGFPPQIIWLRCGNTSTTYIERILRENYQVIEGFAKNLSSGCLELA